MSVMFAGSGVSMPHQSEIWPLATTVAGSPYTDGVLYLWVIRQPRFARAMDMPTDGSRRVKARPPTVCTRRVIGIEQCLLSPFQTSAFVGVPICANRLVALSEKKH
jgi:hypothetical protein